MIVLPIRALPPGVVYSTTIPYTLPPGTQVGPGIGPPSPGVSAIATDASGNSYVTGSVYTTGYPATPGVVQPANAGGNCPYGFFPLPRPCPDAFIAKFDSHGTLLFLTYLGGSGADKPGFIGLDASGNIYVAGETTSADFPLAGNPWRPSLSDQVAFLAKLSGDGKTLIWSTVVSGDLFQLAIAPDGSVYYCASETSATDEVNSISVALTKLTKDGQFATTLNIPSGTQTLAVGVAGTVYIGGFTQGSDIVPTAGAWQTSFGGGSQDAFVARMNPSVSGFAWLTFVGGDGYSYLTQMQPAPDRSIWVSVGTISPNLPVLPGALQAQLSPDAKPGGYLLHLSADGSKALAATYLPAAFSTLALDAAGNVILDAPYPSAFQATPGSPWPCQQPGAASLSGGIGFYGKIDSAGQHLLWGTWTGDAVPFGPMAVDTAGNAVAAGTDGPGDLLISALTTASGPPRLVDSCILPSAFPSLSGPLVPGELISIYGAGFGPPQGVAAEPAGSAIGTELAGVQVVIEGTPAPLLYVSSAQINLVTPYALDGLSSAHVQIVTPSSTSNEVVLDVQPAAPGIFVGQSYEDMPTAAIINQDGTVNSPDHPAHPGDVVEMFASGLGQTDPPGIDGFIPQAPGGTPVLPVTVQLLSAPVSPEAKVTYAGYAPGFVSGAMQVNFLIPSFHATGAGPPYAVSIVLYAGDTFSGFDAPVIWYARTAP
ncbi:MAG TPA: SBBP repeat-containing protein [Bryobacteraceae bacterium]|nr:SBBP repeat-containing protein [Bryobacteraceae bacterium]